MESEPSWVMLAIALALVLGLTACAVWLSITEVKAVKPARAMVRPGRLSLRPGPPAVNDVVEREDSE